MCEAHAYMVTDGVQERIMENVVRLNYDDNGVIVLADLFGDELRVNARIREIALLDNKILLESVAPEREPAAQTPA